MNYLASLKRYADNRQCIVNENDYFWALRNNETDSKVPFLSSRPSKASGEIFRKDLITNRYLDYALRASLDMTGFWTSFMQHFRINLHLINRTISP
ncbi:MAG: hypothetical protein ACI3ZP_03575, partial [Candidatus Cryptobacteroides sp.]